MANRNIGLSGVCSGCFNVFNGELAMHNCQAQRTIVTLYLCPDCIKRHRVGEVMARAKDIVKSFSLMLFIVLPLGVMCQNPSFYAYAQSEPLPNYNNSTSTNSTITITITRTITIQEQPSSDYALSKSIIDFGYSKVTDLVNMITTDPKSPWILFVVSSSLALVFGLMYLNQRGA